WELTARDSVGYHDALGSNMFLHVHRNEVVRGVPRDNEAVNECWLSDRDRYSHEGLYAADRATKPMLRDGDEWRIASWDEALNATAEILQANDVGVLVHPATSNEEGASLAAFDFANIDHRLKQLDFADDAVAEPFAMSVADIEKAKVVLIVGSNIRHEIPLIHQRLHKANKRGQKVFVINPVDFEFTFALAGKQIVKPSLIAKTVSDVANEKAALFEALKSAEGSAVILLGELAENSSQASHIHAAVRELAAATSAKINRIPQGANAVGLVQQSVLPASGAKNACDMLASAMPAYVLYGIEPQYDFANNAQALKSLSNSKVIAFTAFASEHLKSLAHVILPIGLLPDLEASLTNLDGTIQFTSAAGKLPGEARAGWRVLRALAEKLNLSGFDYTDLAGLRVQMKPQARQSGTGISSSTNEIAAGELERIVSTPIYRGDAVLRRATSLNAHPLTHGAIAVLHPEEALARGIAEASIVKLGDGVGLAALPVKTSTRVPHGAIWIESGYEATAPMSATAGLSLVRAKS
ncbi:MAG: molybdopterin-dependent oxidoreductase, partial [Arenimonas sp.]